MAKVNGHKMYQGERGLDGILRVNVVNRHSRQKLRLRLDLWNHSPTGFEAGYGGSGPAQLALAILADALDDDDLAIRLHQKYKWQVIAKLPRNADFTITHAEVEDFMAKAIA